LKWFGLHQVFGACPGHGTVWGKNYVFAILVVRLEASVNSYKMNSMACKSCAVGLINTAASSAYNDI
jgi:hypothetical protein